MDFFEPVDEHRLLENVEYEEGSWYYAIERNSGGSDQVSTRKIALIGIEEPDDNGEAAYSIRRELYKLQKTSYAENIIDLGNFRFNYQPKAYETLGFVLSELISNNIVPIILNGNQDITIAQYLAFSFLKHYVNLTLIDSKLDLNLKDEEDIKRNNFIQFILTKEPSYLFNLNVIGYQMHFANEVIVDFLENLYFELYRLGDVQSGISEIEPVLRSSHFCSFDLASIRQSDSSGTIAPSPNGFYAEEACLISRYAGLSNNMRSMGFYNFNNKSAARLQSASLCAQMVWYFVDGYLNRYPESPQENTDDFMKFITPIQNHAYEIVFYKSRRTDRWWMEVPLSEKEFVGGTHIMPCSYNDYLTATREEIPDRWMQAFKKFS